MSPAGTDLGNFFRENRERQGLTQHEVAEIVGVRQASVSAWELGATRPKPEHLDRLLAVLDVDRDDYARRFRDDAVVTAIERLTAVIERLAKRLPVLVLLVLVLHHGPNP